MTTIININLQIIGQTVDLLETIPASIYRQPLKSLHDHSVGQHTRHIIEFYGCLSAGIQSGVVNYDLRERNTQIENDKNLAIAYLNTILSDYDLIQTDRPLVLNTTTYKDSIQSSLYRELVYLIEHTTHHLAIIKIGLNEAYPAFILSKNLGVASSTINYRNQATAA
jgi:uncharacterized damage-inducible protein DinB